MQANWWRSFGLNGLLKEKPLDVFCVCMFAKCIDYGYCFMRLFVRVRLLITCTCIFKIIFCMKISFHGAARTVTGSKHLLHLNNGKKILLDCGMFQGMGKDTEALNRNFGFASSQVDALILSHGHIDHCGLIPKLVGEGFSGPIYCTPATMDVAAVLLEDSARIQESDIKYSNRKRKLEGRALLEPLYTEEDAKKAMQLFEPVDYDRWFTIMDGVALQFTDAGHIIGSAAVHLKIKEEGKQQQVTFSGDLGRYRDVILRPPAPFAHSGGRGG